jgi:peptidoglycan L-alanyl-D-glutamate endopeptidase CwlK
MPAAATFSWSKRSLRELKGIHPDLRRVCDLALQLTAVDFLITDGKRTVEEQKAHVASGASRTMKSRHLTGHAIDFAPLVDGKVRWEMAYCRQVADAFKAAAKQLGVPIVWGGDWARFRDGPHIELDKARYGG